MKEQEQRTGFQNIQVDLDIWKRIYAEMDEFYNPTPTFAIRAKA